jgi:hypothetical protein
LSINALARRFGETGAGRLSLFDEMVKDGRMPAPKRANSRVIWDRMQLDAAFEALPDDGNERNPWAGVAV